MRPPAGHAAPRDWFDPEPDTSEGTGPGTDPGSNPGTDPGTRTERGLRFSCTRCGDCCSGPPGYVLFTPDEGRDMARALGMTELAFHELYTRDTPAGRSLIEIERDGRHDCVFLDRTGPGGARCALYEARPSQCRTWPFWRANVRSPEAWARAGRGCPGIGRGELHPPELIRLTVSASERSAGDRGPARRA